MVGAGIVALSALFAARGYRMGAICTDNSLVVRGLFRSRTIPACAIDRVASTPRVHWCGKRGRHRKTLIAAFLTLDNTASFVQARSQQEIAEIQRWLDTSGQSRVS